MKSSLDSLIVEKDIKEYKKELLKLKAPPKSENNEKAISYLIKRGNDYNIIMNVIQMGLVYQSDVVYKTNKKVYSNVVFKGYERKTRKDMYYGLRGIYSNFIGEAEGSNKSYSFLLGGNYNSETVHLCESPIDALSVLTIKKMDNDNYLFNHIISLSGI